MTLANVGFFTHGLFWDGRVQTLEQQAVLPVTDPVELHNDWGTIETKFRTHPTYPELFRKAFGIKNKNEITKDLAVKAIAQFERTMVSANSRYDTIFRLQLPGVFPTEEELNGFYMFFDAGQTLGLPDIHCSHCHGNRELLTHNNFDNNGLDLSNDLMNFPDKGRGAVTNITQDNGRFRTPSLRNIELSAPYMHDGRFQTLEQVIEHYNNGGHYAPNVAPLSIMQLHMTEQNKADLLAFLKTFTDRTFINNPKFSKPN